ncbi:toxin co-regulated pilus biosynthesis Q family protein [Photobacterium damselae]|uniref:toxin co-regulated pilus biosynthesis Q family protein n=1 Tax=Photobacterium damselae TaxID=38293 RepID=UPI001F15808C|nr:toxin co-regulated pilus biosynthesis Q family protein [Photobacterium damselae]UKA04701.1 toxin co-regulated pilus biosynthesis Q family protein [Photobacterium damselae subsp. damselae]
MLVHKSKTALTLAAIFGLATSMPASAELLIHTGGETSTLTQGLIGVGSHVTNLGTPYYLKKNVVGFGKDIPLSLAMSSLKPEHWKIIYNNDVKSDQPVSWSRSGNWNDVLGDIAKNNNLVAAIDWNAHQIRLMEMIPTGGEAKVAASNSIKIADDSPFAHTQEQTTITKHKELAEIKTVTTLVDGRAGSGTKNEKSSNNGKQHVSKNMASAIKLVDGLIYDQDSDGCTTKKVNIEKMVMDTSWLGEDKAKEKRDVSAKRHQQVGVESSGNHLDPEKMDHKREMDDLAKDKARIAKLKDEFTQAYILSGDGSFQDFINGGGIITKANENTKYVYVYKKGTLFNTINRWSNKNGFIVKNDVFDKHHVDYENIDDVKLKGTYKEVVTTVLSKYRNAKIPVMFTFYEAGGSKVLHIFESKYRPSYI